MFELEQVFVFYCNSRILGDIILLDSVTIGQLTVIKVLIGELTSRQFDG